MTTSTRPAPHGFDILRLPGMGRGLRWRWGRLLLQIPLLLLTGLMIYDGFTGPLLPSENIATVAAWVHYRGLVMLALLLMGNLFCMACPFTLPRTLARRLSGRGKRWPRTLRSKWLAVALLFGMFWLYEWLDLWASPVLTAWVAVAYFVAAFALEALFAESPFCKYLCPLGSFNFVGSTVSPLQITERDAAVCRTCPGKECVNGSAKVLGCGTELFVPQIQSNLDCVFCLDCARACPYDNVALAVRSPLAELSRPTWPQRWDVTFLVTLWVFASLSNAFGMTPPVYALEATLARWLPWVGEAVILLLIFGILNLLLPAGLLVGTAALSRRLAQSTESLRQTASRFAPALAPLAFGIWLAHYGFHFATGALTLVPVTQDFLLAHGIRLFGRPDWTMGPILPFDWLLPMQLAALLVGFIASLVVLDRRSQFVRLRGMRGLWAALPWYALLALLALAALMLFNLPMEMRGSAGFSG